MTSLSLLRKEFKMLKKINFSLIISVLVGCALFANPLEVDSDALKYKSMNAIRTASPPVIDGNLDDEVWSNAVILDLSLIHI